jgi:hypothetical protein
LCRMLLKYCHYFLLLLLLGGISCNDSTERNQAVTVTSANRIRNPAEEYEVRKDIWYFPPKTFVKYRDSTKVDSMEMNWYSSTLRILKEPVLYDETNKGEVFRFTCLRSHDAPFSIRVEKPVSGPAKLILKIANEPHGSQVEKLLINTTEELRPVQWEQIKNSAQTSDFWQMPVQIPRFGFDGSEWLLEGMSQGKYHVVNRWSPKQNEFHALCLELVGLSGVKFKNVD